MSENKDPRDNPVNNFIENPVTIGAMILIAIIGVAMDMLDGWYALVLIAIGGYGIFKKLKKPTGDGK